MHWIDAATLVMLIITIVALIKVNQVVKQEKRRHVIRCDLMRWEAALCFIAAGLLLARAIITVSPFALLLSFFYLAAFCHRLYVVTSTS